MAGLETRDLISLLASSDNRYQRALFETCEGKPWLNQGVSKRAVVLMELTEKFTGALKFRKFNVLIHSRCPRQAEDHGGYSPNRVRAYSPIIVVDDTKSTWFQFDKLDDFR